MFVIPEVHTISRGKAKGNSMYRGDDKHAIFPKYPVNKCFIILNKKVTDIDMATKLKGKSKRKVYKN